MAEMANDRPNSSRTALVGYASETGNSQEIAEELGRLAERLYFETHVAELDTIKAESLSDYSLVIFAVSTTGQGDFAANGRKFWRSLLLKRLSATYLHHVEFALFGLGDSSYPKFNWASRKLHKRLLQLGANEVYPTGESDEQHPEGIEGTFIPWSLDLKKFLLDKFPLKPGEHPIPDDVRLPPKWVLGCSDPHPSEKGIVGQQSSQAEGRFCPESQPVDHDTRPIPSSLDATLTSNTRVTPTSHWQDVRHLSLTITDPIPYFPGDVLQIYPKNFAKDVDLLIAIMGWEKHADTPLCFAPGNKSSALLASPPPIPFLQDTPGFTLRMLLTNYLDIMAIPRRSFFNQIAPFTDDIMHRERLLEFTNPEYIDEYYDYATRARRSILEVLHEFDSIKIPWQQVCSVFPILRGRQFSIASGGKLKRSPDGAARFDLLVAIVKYQTVIKKIREGVCTKYLAKIQPGSTLKIQLHRGGLNSSMKQLVDPTVLIGPGTGVAPIRSLLWEKAAMAEAFRQKHGPDQPLPLGSTVLLYGGRNRAADFYFKSEWEELKKVLDLKVLTAFSRDQRHKIYVQDLIRQNYGMFSELLHDSKGTIFVCGSSGRMPQAVREALIEAFQKPEGDSGYSRQVAEKYLMDMEKSGRYKQETW